MSQPYLYIYIDIYYKVLRDVIACNIITLIFLLIAGLLDEERFSIANVAVLLVRLAS